MSSELNGIEVNNNENGKEKNTKANWFVEALLKLKNVMFNENPVFVQLLGIFPVLAVSTSLKNGIVMGIATLAVLVASNLVISVFKNIIPVKIKILIYIVIITGFVTAVDYILKVYFWDMSVSLSIFIPLIAVNSILLTRAEECASKEGILTSLWDGIVMGTGFIFAICIVSTVREILGNGTVFDISIMGESFKPALILLQSPGGFLVFGTAVAVVAKIKNVFEKRKSKKLTEIEEEAGAEV